MCNPESPFMFIDLLTPSANEPMFARTFRPALRLLHCIKVCEYMSITWEHGTQPPPRPSNEGRGPKK